MTSLMHFFCFCVLSVSVLLMFRVSCFCGLCFKAAVFCVSVFGGGKGVCFCMSSLEFWFCSCFGHYPVDT